MDDNQLMKFAIEEALKSDEPLRCGAVVAKDGNVIASAFNSQRADNNATAHAEIKVLALAGAALKSKNLDGCTIYCTCEPCAMCLSALSFAKIKRLVYGVSLEEVSPVEKRVDLDLETFLQFAPSKFEVTAHVLEEACKEIALEQ